MSVSKEDFTVKIQYVGQSLYEAHIYLRIHEEMTELSNQRPPEYIKYSSWSRMANYEAGLLRLIRAYDNDRMSLSVLKVISIFESNHRFWTLTSSSNLSVEILRDKAFLEEDDTVKALKHLRDKSVAHTDSRLHPRRSGFSLNDIYGGEVLFKDNNMTTAELESLSPEKKKARMVEINRKLFQALTKDFRVVPKR